MIDSAATPSAEPVPGFRTPDVRRNHGPRPLSGIRLVLLAAAVGGLAFGARLAVVVSGGGLRGMGNYDDGVYFSTAVALVHGRLPYRDFLFLQPPGVLVVLAPFAAVASVVGDGRAFEFARLAFLWLGAVNAALVVVALRRFGLVAGLLGGAFYALFLPAVYAERSTLLEPIGSLGLLLGLTLLAPTAVPRGRMIEVLVGVALGLAVVTKLFYAPAVLLIVIAARGRRRGLLVGCAATGLLTLPLVLLAPAQAWRQIVLDQLGRPRVAGSLIGRLRSILHPPRLPWLPSGVDLLVAVLVVAALLAVAVRIQGGRVPVALFLGSVALLMITPSYYRHYAALAMPALALVTGIGGSRLLYRWAPGRRVVATAAVLAVSAWCVSGWLGSGVRSYVRDPLPAALVRAVAAVDGCVTADDPAVLIWSDTLSGNLTDGCPFWPDTTGWLYDADAPPSGAAVAPNVNLAWQRHASSYFTSGAATVLVREANGLSAATRAKIGVTEVYGPQRFVLRVFAH